MINQISTHIDKLIEENSWKTLMTELQGLDAFKISEVIAKLSPKKQVILFRLLSRDVANQTFQYLNHEEQENIIEGLISEKDVVSNLLNDMAPDVRTALLEELSEELSTRLVEMLSIEERKIATELLSYPEDSIGRLMTPEYVYVKPYYTISESLKKIRQVGRDSETINVIYVVDDKGKLIDDIRIKEIILADPLQIIANIVDNHFVALNAYDKQETAVKIFVDHDRVALPVVDKDGILIGIVTFDDVMQIAEEESTEDFHRFGSVKGGAINPLKASIFTLYKKRIVWLVALVFMNVFSGAAMASFASVIEATVSLVFFLPLLIDSSGNSGSQSATLMIRALAVGDVQIKDWFKLLSKELFVSILLAVTMAAGVAIIANFRAPEIIVIVSLTMFCAVIAGSMIGLLLPFIFTKLKLDPATASAPLITSISDITGVIIYFSIASWILGF